MKLTTFTLGIFVCIAVTANTCFKSTDTKEVLDSPTDFLVNVTTFEHNEAEPTSKEGSQMQLEIVQISGMSDDIRQNNINLALKKPLALAIEKPAFIIYSSAELQKISNELISVCYTYQISSAIFPNTNYVDTVNINPNYVDTLVEYSLDDVVIDINLFSRYLLENKLEQILTFTGGINGEDIRKFNESAIINASSIQELSEKLIQKDSAYCWYISEDYKLVVCVNDGKYYYKYFLSIIDNKEIINPKFVEKLTASFRGRN